MTMTERVARAIAEQDGIEEWEACADLARVAIEAMREPTDEMVDAGHLYASIASQGARDAYQYMIDTALKEEPK